MAEAAEDHAERGQGLLARISNEMVRAQKEFFGKGPTEAKSYLLDDLLFIVMRGGMTTAEKTMLQFGRQDQVRQFRQIFENEMTQRLCDMIEQLTGRKVLTYQSQILFDPDRFVEIFVFDDQAHPDFIRATAEGQLRGESVGEVSAEDAGLDTPSAGGQE